MKCFSQSQVDPLECTLSLYRYSECVPVCCHCWQTGHIGRAGGGCSHAILGLDSGQTRHSAVTKGGPVWWGRQAAGVCVNVYGICLYACSKSWACSPHPESLVTVEGNGHVASFTFFSKTKRLKLIETKLCLKWITCTGWYECSFATFSCLSINQFKLICIL